MISSLGLGSWHTVRAVPPFCWFKSPTLICNPYILLDVSQEKVPKSTSHQHSPPSSSSPAHSAPVFPAIGNSSTIHPVNQARNLNSSETFCSSSHLPASHLAHLLYLLNGFHTYYLLTSVVVASMQMVNTPGDSDGNESACNIGDLGSITGLGRSPEEGNGNPLQYSCQENPMDREAW